MADMDEAPRTPGNRESFSNLEVAPTSQPEYRKYKTPEFSSPIALGPHVFPEVRAEEGMNSAYPVTDSDKEIVRAPNSKKRRLIIIGIIIGILIIIGAVVGGVVGSRHSRQKSEESTPSSTSQSSGNDQNGQSGDAIPEREVLVNSSITAVNWTSGDDAGVHYRAVFWQAVTNDLMASIWESDTNEWTKVNLTLGGTMDVRNAFNQKFPAAKAGTPLAAAVRLHTWPKFNAIALYYLSEKNTVEEMTTDVITAKSGWGVCCLSQMSNKFYAADESQLAAFTVSCNGSQCNNDWIYVAYQDASGKIVRLSEADWTKSLDLTGSDVQMGTGLTMTSTGSQYSNDTKAYVPKMYLQTPAELQEKLWHPDSGRRSRIEGSRTDSSGNPMRLTAAAIPASEDADSGSNNDVLLVSIAGDGSQLLINQFTNQTAKNWTGSTRPEFQKAPSSFKFTAGALIESPDEPRFVGLESNGTIRSFKINQDNATDWSYEGVVFSP